MNNKYLSSRFNRFYVIISIFFFLLNSGSRAFAYESNTCPAINGSQAMSNIPRSDFERKMTIVYEDVKAQILISLTSYPKLVLSQVAILVFMKKTGLSIKSVLSEQTQAYVFDLMQPILGSNSWLTYFISGDGEDSFEICVAGPLREELVFRELIQNLGLKELPRFVLNSLGYTEVAKHVDHPISAGLRIFTSSYLFAAYHVSYSENAIVLNILFLGGFFLGYTRELSDNLTPNTFHHMIQNTMASTVGRLVRQ